MNKEKRIYKILIEQTSVNFPNKEKITKEEYIEIVTQIIANIISKIIIDELNYDGSNFNINDYTMKLLSEDGVETDLIELYKLKYYTSPQFKCCAGILGSANFYVECGVTNNDIVLDNEGIITTILETDPEKNWLLKKIFNQSDPNEYLIWKITSKVRKFNLKYLKDINLFDIHNSYVFKEIIKMLDKKADF